jgi:1-hydroxycarotenoid 3,4-desaturase
MVDRSSRRRVVVIGAGIGGLSAAAVLSAHGADVTVVERHKTSGGKMREVMLGGQSIDSGPTVLTMRWLLEDLFAAAGSSLDDSVQLRPAKTLARHHWAAGEQLDLDADPEQSADAIACFAGSKEADGFRRFCAAARHVYETLEPTFLQASEPSLSALVMQGVRQPRSVWQIRPFVDLWSELGRYFKDRRLRQLFARYATYCGSSPFLAPATLMLIAHVEQRGVWLVEGGMQRLADALEQLARRNGARFRYEAVATGIGVENGRPSHVALASGERFEADAVICNAEPSAAAAMLRPAGPPADAPIRSGPSRSYSALTWSLVGRTRGVPLVRHNVFFSDDYPQEFNDLRRMRIPDRPTVYVCAQDRGADGIGASDGSERLFCLINAPPSGERGPLGAAEIARCQDRLLERLRTSGATIDMQSVAAVVTEPSDFERMFPGTGGALYGPATHGWRASFQRSGVRSRLPGLYLAGGAVHPGAGVPMAALSGHHAARCLMADWASTERSRRGAMPGGTSTG